MNAGTGSHRRDVAIVTGAGSGIGRAVASRLATERWQLALMDVDEEGLTETEKLVEQADGAASPVCYAIDVTEANLVDGAVREIARDLGAIGALVSNAGVLAVGPVLEIEVERWRRTVDVNLTGAFICARAAAREMVRTATPGRIVTIASVHSLAPGTNVADYDASKGGLLMLTRALARELAPHGITVNAVGPGLVLTKLGGGASEEYLDTVVPTIPLGRAGTPSDVAGVVAFLLGPDAGYMTGSLLVVDGGMLLTTNL